MEKNYPSSSKVVVIGGGVIGCSVAYHLTKFGWSDVVLLERDQLTSGTTWHAAGLVSQLGPTATITKIFFNGNFSNICTPSILAALANTFVTPTGSA